jgi:hypothetical protein
LTLNFSRLDFKLMALRTKLIAFIEFRWEPRILRFWQDRANYICLYNFFPVIAIWLLLWLLSHIKLLSFIFWHRRMSVLPVLGPVIGLKLSA